MRIKKLWLSTIAALWCSLSASAHDFEVGGIYYRITSPTDLTVAVTSGDTKYSGSITIPDTVTYNSETYSVTSIGVQAFYGCSSLTAITIPEGVTSIEQHAFNSCRNLTSITIPASVTSIGDEAFTFCSSLTTIVVAEENPIFDSRDGCNAIIGTKSNTLIQGCNSSTIPEGVTCIGSGAFLHFSNLTSITIPASVTSIEEWAFSGCSSLAEINIPENSQLTSIGINAFTSVNAWYNNLPNGVIYLGKVLYGYKGTMPENTSIEVKEGTKGIAASAFYRCSSLTSITIPASVTSIGYQALSGTAWFNNQPDGVVYLGKVLYSYKGTMPENTSIEVKDGTTCIAGNAFYNCTNLTSITIPEGVTSIERLTFYGCSNLTAINIPEGVTSIGVQAFYGCSSLTSITIPSSVTSIALQAFNSCRNLTSITIPENMESIGGSAFYGCSSLKTVINYSDLTLQKGSSTNGYVGGYAESVINIDKTEVDADGYLFKTIDGVPCLIGYFGDDTELTLPDTYNGENYRIVESAFYGCSGLTSITIPEGVTSIGDGAFYGCSGLTAINIPDGVTSIGSSAFSGCSSLESITIPEGVTSIGRCAFSGCTSLASIYMKWFDPVSITSDVFYGVDRNTCTLYVPGASLEKYRSSSIWGEFNNLLAWYKVAYIVDGEEIAHQWLSVGDEISVPILEGYEGYSFESQAWERMISKPINIADNADAMLYSNAPCTETKYGDQFVGWHVLFDGNANTFFHSEYKSGTESADGLDHYLRVDMGEGKSLNDFSFSYTVRGNQNWCTPKVIVVEGSNDADGEYAEIAKLTDFPSDKGAQYNSEIIGNGTSYRYIRYRVIETIGNEKVMGKPYFYIAEFGMTEVQRFEIEETNQMPAYDVVVNGRFVKNNNVETEIHSSELEAQGSQVIYDLMGRRVEKMENGIYIVNGKKVVIK